VTRAVTGRRARAHHQKASKQTIQANRWRRSQPSPTPVVRQSPKPSRTDKKEPRTLPWRQPRRPCAVQRRLRGGRPRPTPAVPPPAHRGKESERGGSNASLEKRRPGVACTVRAYMALRHRRSPVVGLVLLLAGDLWPRPLARATGQPTQSTTRLRTPHATGSAKGQGQGGNCPAPGHSRRMSVHAVEGKEESQWQAGMKHPAGIEGAGGRVHWLKTAITATKTTVQCVMARKPSEQCMGRAQRETGCRNGVPAQRARTARGPGGRPAKTKRRRHSWATAASNQNGSTASHSAKTKRTMRGPGPARDRKEARGGGTAGTLRVAEGANCSRTKRRRHSGTRGA